MRFSFFILFALLGTQVAPQAFGGVLSPDQLDFRASARSANLRVHRMGEILGLKKAALTRAEFLVEQKEKLVEERGDFENIDLRVDMIRNRLELRVAEAELAEAQTDEKIARLRADCEKKKLPEAPKELAQLYLELEEIHLTSVSHQATDARRMATELTQKLERVLSLPRGAYSNNDLNRFRLAEAAARRFASAVEARVSVARGLYGEAQKDLEAIGQEPPSP